MIEDPCPTCRGTGRERRTRRFKVKIPAGVKDGTRIRLRGKGEAATAVRAGGRPLRHHARGAVEAVPPPRRRRSGDRGSDHVPEAALGRP